jgi:glyoxylase-like metal-dependent hydrolase (beta-lactamase superfamily II)
MVTLIFAVATRPAEQSLFDLVEVADGVYAAIALPTYKLNGNAAVIINDDDVVVVDTHSKPSAARALIKQIGQITSKPIRYVINSHFHYDHARGNQAYTAPEYPDATLIASEETRRNLIAIESKRLQTELAQMPAVLTELEKTHAGSGDPASLQLLQEARAYYEEMKTMAIVLPTLTFEKGMTLHKETRDIRLLFLGRAHTSSDVIVYLPQEKIAITSDLLTQWVPGMGDGYANEWTATLDALAKLEIDHIIVGHGGVAGKELIAVLRGYISDMIAFVRTAVADGLSPELTEDTVFQQISTKYADRFPPEDFEFRVRRNIKKINADVRAGLY